MKWLGPGPGSGGPPGFRLCSDSLQKVEQTERRIMRILITEQVGKCAFCHRCDRRGAGSRLVSAARRTLAAVIMCGRQPRSRWPFGLWLFRLLTDNTEPQQLPTVQSVRVTERTAVRRTSSLKLCVSAKRADSETHSEVWCHVAAARYPVETTEQASYTYSLSEWTELLTGATRGRSNEPVTATVQGKDPQTQPGVKTQISSSMWLTGQI